MNINTAVRVAADWWTKKVSEQLGSDFDRTEELREIFKKNIREYVNANQHELRYTCLVLGASGYRRNPNEIVSESVMEIGIEDFVLHRCANLVLWQYYDSEDRYYIWAYENDSDDPDYKKTLLEVD